MYLFLCIIVLLVGFATQEKIKVSVYYEALCPGSREFITKQLYPGYQQLGDDALIIEMVPYVSSIKKRRNKQNKWSLRCQHGKAECYANKVQACVINLNATQEVTMNFFNCHLNIAHPERKSNIKECLRQNKLTWRDIKDCLRYDGNEYLAKYRKQATNLEPPMQYFPHILFNDITNDFAEESSRSRFISTVCGLYKTKQPSGCPSS